MLAAVEIIIARMKSHPDEFTYNINTGTRSRWFNLTEQYRDCLTEEETAAIDAAVKEMRRELFTQDVYKVLTGSGNPEWDEVHGSQLYTANLAKSLTATKDAVTQRILAQPLSSVGDSVTYKATNRYSV